MDRRHFLLATTGVLLSPLIRGASSDKFQYCLLSVGKHWNERGRALLKLSFEVQKRCNIPIEAQFREASLSQVAEVDSPFFIISGQDSFPEPGVEDARMLRLVLGSGGMMLIDDTSLEGDDRFRKSVTAFMNKVYPELSGPAPIPNDHALYQSYYLLKEPRGRLNRAEYLEGWTLGHRTRVFYSANDLLGAMEADPLGNWSHHMEIGGGFRRELCFRLGINMTYYALTINYKKDRAFPPIIERRRRL